MSKGFFAKLAARHKAVAPTPKAEDPPKDDKEDEAKAEDEAPPEKEEGDLASRVSSLEKRVTELEKELLGAEEEAKDAEARAAEANQRITNAEARAKEAEARAAKAEKLAADTEKSVTARASRQAADQIAASGLDAGTTPNSTGAKAPEAVAKPYSELTGLEIAKRQFAKN